MAFNFTTLDSSNLRSVQFILVQCSVSLLAVPKFTHVYQVHRRRRVVEQNQTFGLNKSNGSKNQEKLTRSTKKIHDQIGSNNESQKKAQMSFGFQYEIRICAQ